MFFTMMLGWCLGPVRELSGISLCRAICRKGQCDVCFAGSGVPWNSLWLWLPRVVQQHFWALWIRAALQHENNSMIVSFLANCYHLYTTACFLSRCALLSLLKLHPKSLVILAPVCSSFSYMCTSQSGRSYFFPLGDESVLWVKEGNVMCCRVVLLIWLCCALDLIFLLEQPGEAKFGQMPRWVYFCQHIAYVSGWQVCNCFCLWCLFDCSLFWI